MGQLEKYGLYVLCLVIFLILGVTIWGDPASASPKQEEGKVAARVSVVRGDLSGRQLTADGNGGSVANLPLGSATDLDALLGPPIARPPEVRDLNNSGGGVNPAPTPPEPPIAESEPVAVPPPPRAAAKTTKYIVRKGDILGRIAQKQLGSARFDKLIKQLNPGIKPRNLRPGQVILLPSKANLPGKSSGSSVATGQTAPGAHRIYKVSKGDSLERIARVELGDGGRHKEIQRLNPNVDPQRLQIGQSIKLPLK